ncbi:hypothetical protein [Paraburkholderia sp. BL10I2N1]|nr:hypothetical protein [Paraburkholderia sp. BL10I2N1]
MREQDSISPSKAAACTDVERLSTLQRSRNVAERFINRIKPFR